MKFLGRIKCERCGYENAVLNKCNHDFDVEEHGNKNDGYIVCERCKKNGEKPFYITNISNYINR